MPSGRKVYILQYRLPGDGRRVAPKRMTLGVYDEVKFSDARERAEKLLWKVKGGEDPRPTRHADTEDGGAPTMNDLAKRFIEEYLPGKKKSPRRSTISFYDGIFRCHILPRLGEAAVESVTPADVERLHSAMRRRPYQANRTLSLLQYAFDQAERWGWRPQRTNPALHIDRYHEERRGAKKEVMLNPGQMAALLTAIDEAEAGKKVDPYACAAIRFAFWTGWRISEVLRLEWRNLDLEAGRARLLNTKTADEEYRQVPEDAISVARSLTRIAGSPYVFPGNPGRHLTTVRKSWAKIAKAAGLDDLPGLGGFRLHDLRHNVVSWDVSRGVALEIAGKNVGHRSRRSTEVYAHFAPDALKRAADERAAAMRQAVESSRQDAGR